MYLVHMLIFSFLNEKNRLRLIMKLYKLVKNGIGSGFNSNTISIEHLKTLESISFVAKVRKKTEEIFGRGLSLDTIGTTYGIHIRFKDLIKNKKIAKTLIKIVEMEEELRELKNKNND